MLKSPIPLFVYGTLRRDFDNTWSRRLWAPDAEFLGEARVAGRLYRLGDYPGLKPAEGPRDWVHGEVVMPRGLLPDLDRYEGSSFERRLCVAVLADGGHRDAWAYFYTGRVTGRARIRSGRFTKPATSPRPTV